MGPRSKEWAVDARWSPTGDYNVGVKDGKGSRTASSVNLNISRDRRDCVTVINLNF